MIIPNKAIAQADINQRFNKILREQFPSLIATIKWRQTMFLLNERVIVCLVLGANNIKFCFFNNPNAKLNMLQRWGQTIYSQNLIIKNGDHVDWDYVKQLIENTIKS